MTNTKRSRNTLSKSPWRWSKALDDSASPKDILSRGKTLVFRLAKKPWSNPLEKTYCLEIAVEIVWLSRKFFGFLNVLEEVCSIFTNCLALGVRGRGPQNLDIVLRDNPDGSSILGRHNILGFLEVSECNGTRSSWHISYKKKKKTWEYPENRYQRTLAREIKSTLDTAMLQTHNNFRILDSNTYDK